MYRLKFSKGNSKLDCYTFDLPAGWTCNFARDCKCEYNATKKSLLTYKSTKFQCYAAVAERQYEDTRRMRWNNFFVVCDTNIPEVLERDTPKYQKRIRLHSSGDFFNEEYFVAWLEYAKAHPFTIFYGYTKATPFLVKYRDQIPDNFRFVASIGGTHDHLIAKHNLRYAKVIFHPDEAIDENREPMRIEHGKDECVWNYDKSFCLLLHSQQKAGSHASKAIQRMKKEGVKFSYNKSKQENTFDPVKYYPQLKNHANINTKNRRNAQAV